MCGVAGFLDCGKDVHRERLEQTIDRMIAPLHHRGPDDCGTWCDQSAGLALGHKRLAVLDLSANGHQPMQSACRRYFIVYNGEVYNHVELRRQLAADGYPFRGHSDTEVLLAAISMWGVHRTLERLIGMFALAVWDAHQRRLTLVRDRLGIKPLYYGWVGHTFLFGSELKALRAFPNFEGRIDREAVALYLKHGYIPAPYSIYKGVQKLPPGSLLAITPSTAPARRRWSR